MMEKKMKAMNRKKRITRKLLEQFGEVCERNEAGQHFSEWLDYKPFEDLGWIRVERPIHQASSMPYDSSYWRLELTPLGKEIADAAFNVCGELCFDAVEAVRMVMRKHQP